MGKSKAKKAETFDISEKEYTSREKENISKIIFENVKLSAQNDSQKELLRSIKENQITICDGRAGSGKTICSIFMALNLLKDKSNHFTKIFLVKSVVTLKNEELGFLKGDIKEKVDPFMQSFINNGQKLFRNTDVKLLFDSQIIKFLPLAYIRGMNLDNCIVIVDETQNITIGNARSIMTRIGQNCKMILLGDKYQIDLSKPKQSSLEPILNMFKGQNDFGCIEMNEGDKNCRNDLIPIIEEKFKALNYDK